MVVAEDEAVYRFYCGRVFHKVDFESPEDVVEVLLLEAGVMDGRLEISEHVDELEREVARPQLIDMHRHRWEEIALQSVLFDVGELVLEECQHQRQHFSEKGVLAVRVKL